LFKQEPKTVELQTTSTGIESQDKVLRLRDWVHKNKNEDYSYNDAQKDIENNSKLYQEYQKNIPTQHSIDITPELKASVEVGQPLFKDAEAQYRIESGKNIIEAIKDFNQSKNKARATVALTHEIMHPTVVSIIDGAKEGNEVGTKHTETIVNEFNKANPNSKVTVEDLIKGNDAFKDGTTSKQYRQVQEFIAKAWEKYHTEGGKGFSEAFQKVLDQITKAFQSVYKSITGKQLTPELKQMFDDILGKEAPTQYTEAATPKDDSAIQSGGEQKLPDQKEVPIEQKQEVSDDKLREFPASDPLSGKVDDVVINFIDSQLWKEIAKENESDAIVEGDPLRHFEIPTTGDVIVQEAMATQLKRHPEYEPYVDDWIRMQDDMSLADANMRVLVDNIFATNDFDTALSYIIDVLYDRNMDAELPGVRSFLVNAVIDKLKYTNPLQAHMIMERIYGGQAGIAHSAYRIFGGLRSWTDVSAKEESQLPYELRMQMNEFFSHGAAKKDVMNILGSVKGGKEIEDAIKKVQEANRRTKLTKEENEILAAMADDAQERLDYAMEDVQKVISEISKGERKMQKITANEKKLAKERAGKVSYKMMARRQAETMEQVFTKIKQTLSDVAKKCK
jgi:hypothetical protein